PTSSTWACRCSPCTPPSRWSPSWTCTWPTGPSKPTSRRSKQVTGKRKELPGCPGGSFSYPFSLRHRHLHAVDGKAGDLRRVHRQVCLIAGGHVAVPVGQQAVV